MNTWDRVTARTAWGVLIAFTGLSSYLNARAAAFDAAATMERLRFHALIPPVMLVAAMVAEMVALSSMHRPAKALVVTIMTTVFGITLAASYDAVLTVTRAWNPHSPAWINAALAAVPDLVMVMTGVSVLSLRMRRHGAAPTVSRTPQPSRLRRLADAATARAEAALAVPVEPVTDLRETITEPVTDPVTDPAVKPPRRAPKPAAKPAVDPALEPFMDTAARLADARLVRGKSAVDYAKILHALDQGWSPSRIRDRLGYSHDTTAKVVEAAAAPTLAAIR